MEYNYHAVRKYNNHKEPPCASIPANSYSWSPSSTRQLKEDTNNSSLQVTLSLGVLPGEHSDIMEQKQPIFTVFYKFLIHRILDEMQLFFYATKFGWFYYVAIKEWYNKQ